MMKREGPVLQNIPVRTDAGKKLREAFTAPRGAVLLQADYSGVELRVLGLTTACSAELDGHRCEEARGHYPKTNHKAYDDQLEWVGE